MFLIAALTAAVVAFNLAQAVHQTCHAAHGDESSCELCLPLSSTAVTSGEFHAPWLGIGQPPSPARPSPLLPLRVPRPQCRGPPDVSPLGTL